MTTFRLYAAIGDPPRGERLPQGPFGGPSHEKTLRAVRLFGDKGIPILD
jgi:hypothetical protein